MHIMNPKDSKNVTKVGHFQLTQSEDNIPKQLHDSYSMIMRSAL